jgi:preprotein translocase SecE subunit
MRRSSVAKTIGKDKGTASSARLSSRARGGVANKPAKVEPRDDELLATALEDGDDDLSDASAAEEDADADLALPESRAVVRRGTSEVVARRGMGVPKFMMGNRFTRYLAESYLEIRKVTAPTPREAWNMTLVVVVFSAVVAAILGAADLGLIRFLSWIVSIGTPSSTPVH